MSIPRIPLPRVAPDMPASLRLFRDTLAAQQVILAVLDNPATTEQHRDDTFILSSLMFGMTAAQRAA